MQNHPLILAVDDEEKTLKVLEDGLSGEGFDVTTATNGLAALAFLEEYEPDLILLDIMMPDLDGFRVLEIIRESSDIPVIMLTAKVGGTFVKQAVDIGADNYVTKPFRIHTLTARVRAMLRRTGRRYGADAYLMMPASASVLIARVRSLLRRYKKQQNRDDKSSPTNPPNDLTSTENRLLFCLESGQGRLFSYSQLLTGVWAGKEVSLDTLHYYVRRLRGKIGGIIVQVRGIGYRFSGNGHGADSYTGGTKGGDAFVRETE